MRQFVLPGGSNGEELLELQGKNHRYLSRVLRLSAGDEFPAVDPEGRRFLCRVDSISTDTTILSIFPQKSDGSHERAEEVSLVMGIPKGRKLDQVIRQCTECGVKEIFPLLSRNSDIRLDEKDFSRKLERWTRVAREAQQQSGTPSAPIIHPPMEAAGLKDALTDYDRVLVCHETPRSDTSLHSLLAGSQGRAAVLIGPEGGFSPEELELFDSFHYDSLYLGESVLRAETAALYAVAAVQTIMRESAAWKVK